MDQPSTVYKLILCVFLFLYLFFESSAIEIKTKQGSLKGLEQKSRNGTKFYAFLGIPYAKPPTGNLRFQPPQPPDTWKGVRNATKPPPSCIQVSTGSSTTGQEDCLYLNVYTPANARIKTALPVMVWIHGGSFLQGSGSEYGPEYLLNFAVIFVTINYRLGPLGFLSAGDHILPGNYGMKDQVAALKWIREYIKDFGGNPNLVTIFGESSGAASTHMHLFSPRSKGLFHRVISQSGSALASWPQITPCLARRRAAAFGHIAGCSAESTRDLVDCLRKIPAQEIVQILQKFFVWEMQPQNPCAIVTEPETVADAFLIKNPWKHREVSEVPWIVGLNSGEGALFTASLLSGRKIDELDINYKRYFPITFLYEYFLKPDDVDKTSVNLRHHYFKDKKIGPETAHSLVNFTTDGSFTYDIIVAAQRHTNKSFVYYYDHKGGQSLLNLFGNNFHNLGVSHGDDLFNFFPFLDPQNLTSTDLSVSERLLKYWVHFAYTGNPTADNSWKPSNSKEIDFLHIKTEGDRMKKGLLEDRYLYWKNSLAHPINTFDDKNADLCMNCSL